MAVKYLKQVYYIK